MLLKVCYWVSSYMICYNTLFFFLWMSFPHTVVLFQDDPFVHDHFVCICVCVHLVVVWLCCTTHVIHMLCWCIVRQHGKCRGNFVLLSIGRSRSMVCVNCTLLYWRSWARLYGIGVKVELFYNRNKSLCVFFFFHHLRYHKN